jgi:hypothetical protein
MGKSMGSCSSNDSIDLGIAASALFYLFLSNVNTSSQR